jgi:hypothetical protein
MPVVTPLTRPPCRPFDPGAEDGKGTSGCILFLLLSVLAGFVAMRVGPDFYAYKSFEGEVKTEVSRAGAHFADDETLLNNLVFLAKKNEIRVARENVKIERFAGQVHVTVRYTVPVDLVFYQREIEYEIKASSYVGRL